MKLLMFLATQTMRWKILALSVAMKRAPLGLSTTEETATGSISLCGLRLISPFSVFPLAKWRDCPAYGASPHQLSLLWSCDCRKFWNPEVTWSPDGQSARGHVVRIMEGQADAVLEGHASVLWGHGWSSEKVVRTDCLVVGGHWAAT